MTHFVLMAPRNLRLVRQAMSSLSLSFCFLLGILILFAATSLCAQQQKPAEYAVKAAYLYNFGRFVEWPDTAPSSTGGSFPICVLGDDPFGRILDGVLAGQTIDGKPVLPKRLSKYQEAVNCRILFIRSLKDKELTDALAALDKAGVLTVSDMPEFLRRGGMIEFVLERNKVRFQVNLAIAEAAGLSLSSELLKVAVAVQRTAQPGD